MDSDVVMQDGDRPDYPEPLDSNSEPYPAIPANVSTSPPDSTSILERMFGAEANLGSTTGTTSGFTSLSDYFGLGGSGGGSEIPRDTGSNRQKVNGNHGRSVTDFLHHGEATTAISTSTSLPGFHVLPENDTPAFPRYNDLRTYYNPNSHRKSTQQSSSRGQPRGRDAVLEMRSSSREVVRMAREQCGWSESVVRRQRRLLTGDTGLRLFCHRALSLEFPNVCLIVALW